MSATAEPRIEPTSTESPFTRPRLLARLFEPVPIAPLVQFRIALGLILLWEAYRYVTAGWPRALFLDRNLQTPEFEPPVLFHYYGFEWVRPLAPSLMSALFPVLGFLAVCFAAGAFFRLAAGLLFLGWTYVFLLDQSLYLNHLYLVTMVTGMMAFLPASRAYSLDALFAPKRRSDFVPRWTVGLLRFQIGIVYFFGGIAKLGGDWLSGVPMQLMLVERTDLLGPAAREPWVALFFAYGGLLLDLFIVPLLWWRRTRILGLLLAAGFHLTNHVLFRIGIFPWAMMAATLILWPPVPLSIVRFARIYGPLVLLGMIAMVVFPAEGRAVPSWAWAIVPGLVALWTIDFWFPEWQRYDLNPEPTRPPGAEPSSPRVRPAVVALLGLFVGWQVLLPFRHLLYPGDANWTEEGHKWSWQMKLRVKHLDARSAPVFLVIDGRGRLGDVVDPLMPGNPFKPDEIAKLSGPPDEKTAFHMGWLLAGRYHDRLEEPIQAVPRARSPLFFVSDGEDRLVTVIDPFGEGSPLSFRKATTMATRPELVLQFAHHLRDEFASRVPGPVKVRAYVHVSLNGRPPRPLIDPKADLAAIEDRLWPPATWILPLEEPRPKLGWADGTRLRVFPKEETSDEP